MNVICDDYYFQFLKNKNENKLHFALLYLEEVDKNILEEIKLLQFEPGEENLIRSFDINLKIETINEVSDLAKNIFEQIYKASPLEPLKYEEFFGRDLDTNPSEFPKNIEKKSVNNENAKVWLFVIGLIVLIGFYIYYTNKPSRANSMNQNNSVVTTVSIGAPLRTRYFDVIVNSVKISSLVNTGNVFSSLKSESGESYIIIDITFKNTDNESRTILDGSIHISYNGTDYNYDKSETILADGWGSFLDQINPLTSKTTKLVYKIPSEIKGEAYYNPGRTDGN